MITRRPRPHLQRGLSMLEFVVVLSLFSILIAIGAGYAREVAVRYEQASLEYSVNQMRAALALKFADMLMRGQGRDLARLQGQNPFDWMEVKPANYRGLASSEDYARIEPGSWIFDPGARTVVYFRRYLTAPAGQALPPTSVRFRVELPDADASTPTQPRLLSLGALPRHNSN